MNKVDGGNVMASGEKNMKIAPETDLGGLIKHKRQVSGALVDADRKGRIP
jgi:hypothetical protein